MEPKPKKLKLYCIYKKEDRTIQKNVGVTLQLLFGLFDLSSLFFFSMHLEGGELDICQHTIHKGTLFYMVINMLSKTLLCNQKVTWLCTPGNWLVHLYTELRWLQLTHISSDLRLCRVTPHSISAPFDEWGQGHSVVIGSLTNRTLVLTQSQPAATLETVCLIKEAWTLPVLIPLKQLSILTHIIIFRFGLQQFCLWLCSVYN